MVPACKPVLCRCFSVQHGTERSQAIDISMERTGYCCGRQLADVLNIHVYRYAIRPKAVGLHAIRPSVILLS